MTNSSGFARAKPEPAQYWLVVLDLATRHERNLADIAGRMIGAPAWSPDGKEIAVSLGDTGPGPQCTIALFDARSGHRRDWVKLPHTIPVSFAWVRGGTAIAMAGQYLGTSTYRQITLHPYPAGAPSRITNDFNQYGNVSASLSDDAIAAVRSSLISSIYLADANGSAVRRLTTATGSENSFTQARSALDTMTILCQSPRNGVLQIWAVGTAGEAPRALTGTDANAFNPRAAAGIIAFDRLDSTGIQVWVMNSSGGTPRQLTHGARLQVAGLSRDGRYVFVEGETVGHLTLTSTADGRVVRDLGVGWGTAEFSPDTRSLLLGRAESDAQGHRRTRYEVLPLEGGDAMSVVRPPADAVDVRWEPGERSVTFIDHADSGWNVFRMSLDGGAPVRVTHVTDGRVVLHEWSPDGRRLGILVRNGARTDLWVTDAEGRKPVRVTQLSPEIITRIVWMNDSRHLIVEASTRPADVVLIRDFR